jgi:hypothetical protein
VSGAVRLDQLAAEVRAAYRRDPAMGKELIEDCLSRQLEEAPPDLRCELLAQLIRRFERPTVAAAPIDANRQEALQRHLERLLGRGAASLDIGSEEFAEKLAKALNTVFDSLNAIIGTINATLLGSKPEMETIRHVIGSSMEGATGTQSIEVYLEQIQTAFLVAHAAFQDAARIKVRQFLAELDPERIGSEAEGGLKFGALRKAELFDIYKDKYRTCTGWLDSGRFTEELLREFERICQKLYTSEQGGRK